MVIGEGVLLNFVICECVKTETVVQVFGHLLVRKKLRSGI